MKSIKCPQCGLTNWETSEWCKRCKCVLKSKDSVNYSAGSTSQNTYSAETNTNQNYASQTENSREKPPADSPRTSYSRKFFDKENSFIAKNIERCNRNLMIVCVLVITAVIGGFLLNVKYLSNAFLGPASVSQDEVAFGINLPGKFRNYVKVNADEVYDTGGKYISISKYKQETVKSNYVALEINGKFLLAEVDANSKYTDGAKNIDISGEIVEMPGSVSEKIVNPILREQPDLRSDLLPVMLKAGAGYSTFAYIGTAVGIILFLIAAFSLKSVLESIGHPEDSSLFKSLQNFGSPSEVAASIDDEINSKFEKIGPVYLLPNWIIRNGTFKLEVQHVEEVVWVYKKVTKHSVNFIPTGKTYEVVLHNSQGLTISLNGSFMNESKTDKIMQAIYERVPWIIFGYDNEITNYWHKNREGFIGTVKERRKSYSEQVSSQTQTP